MAARKSGLGRGLDALIPVEHPETGFAEIALSEVLPNPQQPRTNFDDEEMAGLAASITAVGVLQPIVVRTGATEGEYVLIAGERRVRAAAQVGLETIPAVIRSGGSDEQDLTEAVIENVQRSDLSPLEEAAAYQNLLENFGMTHEAIAAQVGKSRSAVTNTIRLLQLPAAVQAMLDAGDLSAGHGRALLGLEDQAYAIHIAERAVADGWPVRKMEQAVRERQRTAATVSREPPPPRPAEIIELEERLAEHLEAKVGIDYRGRGGKVIIRFGSLDELERIYRQLFSGISGGSA